MINWFLTTDPSSKGDVTFWESLSITAICVLIVFAMLILLALVVAAFQLFAGKKESEPVEEDEVAPTSYVQPSTLKLEDIKDEDMMVAALVATIDYHEETKKDVRIVSIKQIG